LLRGKRSSSSARGGIYSKDQCTFDFQEPYLRAVLGFVGMDNIRVVRIEGGAMGEAALARGIDNARAQQIKSCANCCADKPAKARRGMTTGCCLSRFWPAC
jgi:FMN-dependent NADH-azoreductase